MVDTLKDVGKPLDPMAEADLLAAHKAPVAGSRWRHCKGNVYVVVGHAIFEEDCDVLVLYVRESDVQRRQRARRLSVWLSHHPDYNAPRYVPLDG